MCVYCRYVLYYYYYYYITARAFDIFGRRRPPNDHVRLREIVCPPSSSSSCYPYSYAAFSTEIIDNVHVCVEKTKIKFSSIPTISIPPFRFFLLINYPTYAIMVRFVRIAAANTTSSVTVEIVHSRKPILHA